MVTTARARRTAALTALWNALRGSAGPGVGARLRALPRMLALGFGGRYPHLGKGRIALAALALVYVISPVDAVPELVVPFLGLADDALVTAWLAGVVLAETDAFLGWEAERARTVVGEVVR
jgi:uncharacterized membrane protein YkvA (DUF1232 family)